MADEQQTTAEAQEAPAEAIVDVDATAERLTEIASQSLDTNEVARQIEELTSVVLDSAEVSTRSASIAADVSATMRAVVSKIQENNRRNVMHSRIMLGAFCACLLIAMGIFFAITMKMTKSIKELDTMVYAMAKRVIEVDASLTAIGKTNSDFSEITDKQEEVITTQTQVAKRLEELSKSMANMPTVVATEANKSSDLKFKDMQKQLTTMESKLQSFDTKLQTVADKASARVQSAPAPAVAQGPSTQVLLAEIQKLKSDLNAAMQNRERSQSAAEANALKTIDKNLEKAAIVAGEAQKAADKAAQAAKASAASEKAANDAQRAAAPSGKPIPGADCRVHQSACGCGGVGRGYSASEQLPGACAGAFGRGCRAHDGAGGHAASASELGLGVFGGRWAFADHGCARGRFGQGLLPRAGCGHEPCHAGGRLTHHPRKRPPGGRFAGAALPRALVVGDIGLAHASGDGRV